MIPDWSTEEAEIVLNRVRPPQFVIDACARAAAKSPCMKSKRGSVLFNPEEIEGWATGSGDYRETTVEQFIVASGWNGPPPDFRCTRNSICRKACGQICVHAEERAIRAAGCLVDLEDLELVHIKVQEFPIEMGPVELAHTQLMTLPEGRFAPVATGTPSCTTCARTIADTAIKGVWLWEMPGRYDDDPAPAWRFYEPREFYERTMDHERNNLPYARVT